METWIFILLPEKFSLPQIWYFEMIREILNRNYTDLNIKRYTWSRYKLCSLFEFQHQQLFLSLAPRSLRSYMWNITVLLSDRSHTVELATLSDVPIFHNFTHSNHHLAHDLEITWYREFRENIAIIGHERPQFNRDKIMNIGDIMSDISFWVKGNFQMWCELVGCIKRN